MSFTDFRFIVFFIVVYVIMLLFKLFKKNLNSNIVKIFLLFCSYLFVAYADIKFCICLVLLTIFTYFIGKYIDKNNNNKIYLVIGIIICALQLAVFKYFNFFTESICSLIGRDNVTLKIIVPLGVSFYTFSAISYLVDIYRKKYRPANNILDFALYMAFFPKLISGPIIRPNTFLTQINEDRGVTFKNFELGIQILVFGLFKKMVLADHLGVFVDDVFNYTNAFNSLTIWLGVFAYSLQIYFDFSGYSDIAIGISKMLGFDFDKNFDIPYISKNVTEFWKRWHISLSSWLQDYLYIPLGGNRKGKTRTYINLFLTMLIGGLWHGANYTFIIWGMLHGIALIIHKLYMNFRKTKFNDISNNMLYRIICMVMTFIFVSFCWIFFRADTFNDALNIIQRMFSGTIGINQIYIWIFVSIIFLVFEIIMSVIKSKRENSISLHYPSLDFNNIFQLTIFFIFVGLTIILAYVGETQFIYGQF